MYKTRMAKWGLKKYKNHRITRQLSSPEAFQLSEELHHTIRSYINGSFDCGAWISDVNGDCINTRIGVSKLGQMGAITQWSTNCETAIKLTKAKSFVEARVMLDTACDLVRGLLLEAEDPRFLDLLIEPLIAMKDEGLDQETEIMRHFIRDMAENVLAQHGARPWVNVCRLIGMVKKDQLEGSLIQSWSCTADFFEQRLGRFHKTALNCRIGYIHRAYLNMSDKEKVMGVLLQDCEQQFGRYSPFVLKIMYIVGLNLLSQERFVDAELLGLDLRLRAGAAKSDIHEIWGLEVEGEAQYHLNKRSHAESNTRKTIKMLTEKWSNMHPWTIKQQNTLETWLREWGRIDEAQTLKAEISNLALALA